MKKDTAILFVIFISTAIIYTGCNVFGGVLPSGSEDDTLYSESLYAVSPPLQGDVSYSVIPKDDKTGNLKSVLLGEEPGDTYVLFTNLVDNNVAENSPSAASGSPLLHQIEYFNSGKVLSDFRSKGLTTVENDKVYSNASKDTDDPNNPSITDFNDPEGVKFWELETESDNFTVTNATEINATCRKVVSNGEQNLSIWVADDSWGNSQGKINSTMVDALADSFLKDGEDHIYDWVTGIYGEEWGTHDYEADLISDYDFDSVSAGISQSSTEDWITILLYDIGLSLGDVNSVVFGYFNGLNNFIRTDDPDSITSYSSERIMFCLNASLFAIADDSNWSVDDYWPSVLISTLAHEFQHMLCFYQKAVLKNADVSTWVNEMLSLITEDLLADKMGVRGPRGVSADDGTAGGTGILNGRLPSYVMYPEDSLVDWGQQPYGSSQSYSTAYSYGAYLARNYDGARLFREIQHSPYGDYRAVEDALDKVEAYHAGEGDTSLYNGIGDLSFDDTIIRWGVANLISDLESPIPALVLNKGTTDEGWFTDSLGYRLGSIDLSRYGQIDQYGYTTGSNGLSIFSSIDNFPVVQSDYSHLYYLAGEDLSGMLKLDISVPDTVQATLIRRK